VAPVNARPGGRLAEEQAALRRVAVLAARGAPPEEIFAAVTAEVRQLLDIDLTGMGRYNPDGTLTIVARWNMAGAGQEEGPGPLGGLNVSTMVYETGQPARLDDYSQASGPLGDAARKSGVRSCVGVPISVEGRL
jgi:GAF domain-containing protein